MTVKLRQVNYNDGQEIESITVTMSLAEAAAIAAIAGKLNGHAWNRLGLSGDDSLSNVIGFVFNAHYEHGRPDKAPVLTDLRSINDPY